MTTYLGIPLPLQRNHRGYFAATSDPLENEKSKFINLILTMKGERVANPEFGCDIHKLLFEQKTDNLQDRAQQYILDAVERWMPYLRLRKIEITNINTFFEDHNINLYVQYTFANNPQVAQSVQIDIGKFSVSGRLVTNN